MIHKANRAYVDFVIVGVGDVTCELRYEDLVTERPAMIRFFSAPGTQVLYNDWKMYIEKVAREKLIAQGYDPKAILPMYSEIRCEYVDDKKEEE